MTDLAGLPADWATLPRCGECYRSTAATAVVVDHWIQIGHRLDAVLPG